MQKSRIIIIILIILTIFVGVVFMFVDKKVLSGYYYNNDETGYLKISEDGTFDYVIQNGMAVSVCGNYSIEDGILFLDSNHGLFKFKVLHKKIKFLEGNYLTDNLVKENEIYRFNSTEKNREEYKLKCFIKNIFIVLLVTTIAEVCEVIYKRNRRRLLYGFYYSKKKTEYIEIKEDGTFNYVITEEGLQVKGSYSVDKYCLTLNVEASGVYKFEILYKGLKFIESDDMTKIRLKKNERYRWSEKKK